MQPAQACMSCSSFFDDMICGWQIDLVGQRDGGRGGERNNLIREEMEERKRREGERESALLPLWLDGFNSHLVGRALWHIGDGFVFPFLLSTEVWWWRLRMHISTHRVHSSLTVCTLCSVYWVGGGVCHRVRLYSRWKLNVNSVFKHPRQHSSQALLILVPHFFSN